MARKYTALFAVMALVVTIALGGAEGKRSKKAYEEPLMERETSINMNVPITKAAEPNWSAMTSAAGTYTTLSGYYDYQSNGGCANFIRVDPATGDIHVTYAMSDDSLSVSPSRGTAYAYSTDGGLTWNNFSQVRVPARRSGFPALDLGRGGLIAGSPVIANHNDPAPPSTANNAVYTYIDSPPGSGAFIELSTPPPTPAGGSLQPIWPYIAATANGSLVIAASPNINPSPENYRSVMDQSLLGYSSWAQFPTTAANQTGGRNPVAANGNGRVGVQVNTSNGSSGIYWIESVDNGVNWPTTSQEIYGLERYAGAETLSAYVHSDVVYNGDNPLMVITEYNAGAGTPSNPRIVFWSSSTGFVWAAPWNPALYPITDSAPQQRFHNFGVGWPTIGMAGTDIVVAYQAFQRESSSVSPNYQFSDIWFVKSSDGGTSWSTPVNLTNTPYLDERYPSISKWNATGQANIVWQEDTEPGAHAFADGAPVTRSYLKFLRYDYTSLGVGDDEGSARQFKLEQNYPNPFNPSTRINYSVPKSANVRLVVYNALGQEIATLVDGYRNVGSYAADFSAANVASGVYFYTLTAGEFSSTKKMVLMK